MCAGGWEFDPGFGFGRWVFVYVSLFLCFCFGVCWVCVWGVNFCWVSCGRWGGGGGRDVGGGSCARCGVDLGRRGRWRLAGCLGFGRKFFCGQCGHGSSVVGMRLDFVGFVEDFVRLAGGVAFWEECGGARQEEGSEGFD